MSDQLEILIDWEQLGEGSPEERVCFGELGIRYGNIWLTEVSDSFVNRVRKGPLISGYHLAEWFAWNWWRLRWEPRSKALSWPFSHRMATIGEGYIWPDITIFSDGERVALLARATAEREQTPLRYICSTAAVIRAVHFESAIDSFVGQIHGQLHDEKIVATNLQRIWEELSAERRDPDLSMRRKIEALLGCDPDEASTSDIERLVADAGALGRPAIDEIAAERSKSGIFFTADSLGEIASTNGFDSSPRDAVQLRAGTGLPRAGDVPAWVLGTAAAKELRDQQQLGDGQITNDMLAKLAGVQPRALTQGNRGAQISFALDAIGANSGRVVLRSKWETGRRFNLARILGDRIVRQTSGRLFPATQTYTYRQKIQRAFAAEFLSPFDAVDEMLVGDYSSEKQQDVAQHFNVSELTIRTLLVNHRRIEREGFDEDFDTSVAA